MAVKVFRNLDAFTAQFVVYNTRTRTEQREAMRKSQGRIDRALDAAAVRLAGSDRRLSGVGRNGALLSHRSRASPVTAEGTMRVVFTKQGPWQIKDNTVRGGPTRPHPLTPNLRKSPRPMDPAKKFMPSMKTRTGKYITNYSTGDRPYVVVQHHGSSRQPAWGNAIESVMPIVTKLHADAFRVAGYSVFG